MAQIEDLKIDSGQQVAQRFLLAAMSSLHKLACRLELVNYQVPSRLE